MLQFVENIKQNIFEQYFCGTHKKYTIVYILLMEVSRGSGGSEGSVTVLYRSESHINRPESRRVKGVWAVGRWRPWLPSPSS